MIPTFTEWMYQKDPLALGHKALIVAGHDLRFSGCFGYIRDRDDTRVGLEIPIVGKPGQLYWYALTDVRPYK